MIEGRRASIGVAILQKRHDLEKEIGTMREKEEEGEVLERERERDRVLEREREELWGQSTMFSTSIIFVCIFEYVRLFRPKKLTSNCDLTS